MDWKTRQAKDPWVKAARRAGWRSRAVFKLQEIDARHKLFRRGMCVVDLGAAPGAWSQYAASKVGKTGSVVAVDLREMQPLHGVEVLCCDLRTPQGLARLRACLGARHVGLVISDMAPDTTGIATVDVLASLALAQIAMEIAVELLAKDGTLLVKLFQGTGFDEYLADLRRRCSRAATVKPKASRAASRETYVLAKF